MEADPTHAFNQKLSQWVASQGFWFQLRHSLSGGGWSTTVSHLTRLGFKLLVVLVLAVVAFIIFLVKRVESEPFVESLEQGLKGGLSAADTKILEVRRTQGHAMIRRVGVEGGDDSFFRSLDAANVRFKMPVFAGFIGSWDGGTLQAKRLEVGIKAGADSDDHAKRLADSLFREWPGFGFSSVDVEEASIRWGYGRTSAGRIEKSRLAATRSPGGWQLSFSGGTFTQNWLSDLEIVNLVIHLGREGMRISEGKFKAGTGMIVLNDVMVRGGATPRLEGKVELAKAEVSALLPEAARALVSGEISGELAISGSTNSTEGIGLKGDIRLAGGGTIGLGERIPLLKALALADPFNSYRKVEFKQGGFHMETGGGAMKLSRIDLSAGDLMTMRGNFEIRYPTEGELSGATGTASQIGFTPVIDPMIGALGGSKESDFSLRKAAKAPSGDAEKSQIFDRREQERLDSQLDLEEMIRRSQSLRCVGEVQITLPATTFDRNATLRETYPVDAGSGRIAVEVPLTGGLFELTRSQAEEISRVVEKRDR